MVNMTRSLSSNSSCLKLFGSLFDNDYDNFAQNVPYQFNEYEENSYVPYRNQTPLWKNRSIKGSINLRAPHKHNTAADGGKEFDRGLSQSQDRTWSPLKVLQRIQRG